MYRRDMKSTLLMLIVLEEGLNNRMKGSTASSIAYAGDIVNTPDVRWGGFDICI
jgi:hypothetical protein